MHHTGLARLFTFQFSALLQPSHFCPMGAMIVMCVALFTNYSLFAKKYNVNTNRTFGLVLVQTKQAGQRIFLELQERKEYQIGYILVDHLTKNYLTILCGQSYLRDFSKLRVGLTALLRCLYSKLIVVQECPIHSKLAGLRRRGKVSILKLKGKEKHFLVNF